ncbi:MAG: hypothetical protein LUO79_08870, partial [Methanomassiliicoccales archaeon]|nr:hypothetical protein [Methanomassiliicoccales archaeon]
MKAVLFDLGHTLIDYYNDWRLPEERAVGRVAGLVRQVGPEGVEDATVAGYLFSLLDEGRRLKRSDMVEIPLDDVLARLFRRFSCADDPDLMSESLQAFYGVLL